MEQRIKRMIGTIEHEIIEHISPVLPPGGLPAQIIQSSIHHHRGERVLTSFFASSNRFRPSDCAAIDVAVWNIRQATIPLADRMAERERADLVGMDKTAAEQSGTTYLLDRAEFDDEPEDPNDAANYDGPGDNYYEGMQGGYGPTPEDMDRYKQLK